MDEDAARAALRQIGRGFLALADALGAADQPSEVERQLALMREWGDEGLDRSQASAMFRKHGFAPQSAGGWVRGEWLETRTDGLRYLTERSLRWLADQRDGSHD